MPSASLFLVQCLLVTSAASECADQSCANPDTASLLQNTVQVGVVTANQETKVGCASHLDETACDQPSSGCNWNPAAGEDGGSCAAGCATFDIEEGVQCTDTLLTDCCPAYCMFVSSHARCLATTDMRFGGIRVGTRGYDRDKDVVVDGVSKSTGYKAVPQYLTTSRLHNGVWESCEARKSSKDCFYGTGTSSNTIDVTLEGNYESVAAEVDIKCEHEGQLEFGIKDRRTKNALIKMFYNGEQVCGEGHADDCGTTQSRKSIPISSTDAVPIFRVEMTRENSAEKAKTAITIEATHIKASFDSCMDFKEGHGQCLEVFGPKGKQYALRSSHHLQAQCIGGVSGIDGCGEWLQCLSPESKQIILKAVDALGLLQSTSMALLAQDLTKTSLKCTQPAQCVDPANLDIEAFDCNCFDWMNGASSTEIRDSFCCDNNVCCDWKTEDRCPSTLVCPTLLVEVNESSMMQRSQAEKTSEHDASLDESLSGKRC